MCELILPFFLWGVVTVAVFWRSKIRNEKIQHEFLKITWEPYAISGGLLAVLIGVLA